MVKLKEIPFETYEDLINSGLKIYDANKWLKNVSSDDVDLSKVTGSTRIVQSFRNCTSTLKKWKNVSCIVVYDSFPLEETLTTEDLDGLPLLKIFPKSVYIHASRYYHCNKSVRKE